MEQMTINSKQNIIRTRTILALIPGLSEEDKDALKEDLCEKYSGGRTKNIRYLTQRESGAMIKELQAQVPKDPSYKMKKSIIRMAMEINWKLPNGKIDMERLNAWCVKYGPNHKPMDDHEYSELPKLVTAFKKNYEYVLKKM